VQERYRGQWLGWVWLVLAPLLMVAVYTLVLRHAMGVRWGGAGWAAADAASGWVGDVDFGVRLMCALLPFNWLAECLSRAPRLVSDVPHLVKKVVFPLEVLPWVAALAAMVPLVAGLSVTLLAQALAAGSLSWTVLWLPLVWLPLLPLGLGLMWAMAAVGTYVKDVGQLVAPALGALLFLSPVFYELRSLPEGLRDALGWSPLALVMEQTRAVVVAGQAPDLALLSGALGVGLVVALLGAALFQRVRAGFADVV
jgi:lipopolysaccharide transport system permease protein